MISHPNAVVQVHSQLSFTSQNPSFGKICRDENRVVRRQFPELRLLPSFLPSARSHSTRPFPPIEQDKKEFHPFLPSSFLPLPPVLPRSLEYFPPPLRRSSVRSQMKYNPLADGRTDGHGRTATRTVSGARLSEIGSFVPLLEGRTTTKGVL